MEFLSTVFIGVAMALGAGLALFFVFRRRRAKRRRRKSLSHPVVLVHGVFGFDEVSLGRVKETYFRGLPAHLQKLGTQVYVARMPPTSSVETRARTLANLIDSIDAKRVNIIAHSMGGLDARYAISELGLRRRVVSLTTIGSPHRGTPLADFGTGVLGDKLGLRQILSRLSVHMDAFYDLTTLSLEAFNKKVRDRRGVHYASVIGAVNGHKHLLNPLLLPSYMYLQRAVGDNDGLVPASSQAWGDVLLQVEADHWAQIGWSRQFDALAFYAQLIRELTARGL